MGNDEFAKLRFWRAEDNGFADSADSATSAPSASSADDAAQAEYESALEALLATGMLGDSDVIREILSEADAQDEIVAGEAGVVPEAAGAVTGGGAGAQNESAEALAERVALDAQVEEIYRAILERAPEHKVQPSLERVEACLDMMGNPHRSFRAIHITGTNGKTSTARMCEALLREHGLHTGRFTSPHLESVRERISIDGQAISRTAFIETWQDVAPFIEMVDAASQAKGGPRMSFFEVFVVMAYQAFAAAPVDVAVIEVGMGGRWDATNVIDADVAVLMPVGLDHEKWLGSELEDIAAEKLGIVKPGCSFVVAEQPAAVEAMAREKAAEVGAHALFHGESLRLLHSEMAVGGQMIGVQTPAARYEGVPLGLRGRHQGENAAIAIAAVEAFFGGRALAGDIVEQAFMNVSSPGRLEVVRTSPTILVDACHNPHGAAATAEALEESFPGRRVGIVAMMADKDMEGFLGVMEPVLDEVVITGMPTERAAAAEDLAEIARGVFGQDRVHVEEDLLEAVDLAAARAEADDSAPMASPVVIICGSIQLIGRARTLLGATAPDGVAQGN